MSLEIDRVAPTRRPAGRAVGYHVWRDLTFIHWTLPVEMVAPLIPAGLTLDTWEGEAWVGLVPFYMSDVRPWWSPPVPGLSCFCETNVRTYVHHRGKDPGVWFFSLEAANSIAVKAARWGWHLPYFRAKMALTRAGNHLKYSSHRLWPQPVPAGCEIQAEFGGLLGAEDPNRRLPAGMSIPGTLEHFLIERYILYAQRRDRSLLSGRVYHTPYPVRGARLIQCDQTLLPSAGIHPQSQPRHIAGSDGVRVEVFPLERLD